MSKNPIRPTNLPPEQRSFLQSLALRERFHQAIPGGAHTYAKGDDQFPEFYPPIMAKGKGCHVWDVDGNEYIEWGMGLRAISLGHAYDVVNWAACQQMNLGSNYSRPAMIELEAAELFLDMVPGADMVKFAKNGSDATTAAIKLARAATGRDKIAICGDHPFFSVDDWFIGNTAINAGIPDAISELTLSFNFNDLDSVKALLSAHPGEIACFIMEPEKYSPVDQQFLFGLQELCKAHGCVFILDEMITGFRWHEGGAQTMYGIEPDLSTFGKAIGNGYAIAALAGKRELMELGGLHHAGERVFLLSTTHGAENHSLAAFMAVAKEYRKHNVIEYFKQQGERLRKGFQQCVSENRLQGYVDIVGHPSCMVFATRDENKQPYSQPFRTLFMQEMIKRGVIGPNLVISYSHRDEDVDRTLEVLHEVMGVYRKAIDEGVDKYLEGRPVAPVYRKYN
ncbi:MAG: glutamate-1-semialdehyde 2,1-aminomutase [Bacteroidota bacterium]